jgi:LacI family transcriptional regulator
MAKRYARVKISDIAQKAGVSTGTVDRVINGRGEVAPKTRQKILDIIRELNYEPHILASTLASKKQIRIASLLPEADKNNSFWLMPDEGIQAAWEEISHYGVILEKHYFTYHEVDSFKEKLDAIIGSKPSGVIMAPLYSSLTQDALEVFQSMNIPVVFINSDIENQQNRFFVGQDSRQSGIVAAQLLDFSLNDLSQTFIIHIFTDKIGNTHIKKREMGFREYVSGKGQNPLTITINTQNHQEIEALLEQGLGMLENTPRKTGIFVTNSRVYHVAAYLKKHNLNHIRLVGYDLLMENQYYLKNDFIDFLISQKPWEQGYKSVTGLFNNLVMKKQVPATQYLPIDIITKENIDYYLNI